jgi:flagellar basal body-associated protein FliL
MSEQSPKDLGAAANLLLVVAVLLAIVGTGVIVLVYGPRTSARVEEATQTVAPAAALAPPADIGRR